MSELNNSTSSEINNSWKRFFPIERRVTFDDRRKNDSYYARTAVNLYDELVASSRREEWRVDHPMTGHPFPSERSGDGSIVSASVARVSTAAVNIPRRRSRSFNDFIEKRSNDHDSRDACDNRLNGWGQYDCEMETKTETEIKNNNYGEDDTDEQNTTTTSKSSSNYDSKNDEDDDDQNEEMPFYVSMLYGGINCTIIVPVIMSFGNIIYRDDAFAKYMPILIKLTMFSGTIHQLCFSMFSSLPFAVGSVQDAGLIFLSKMAHDMVQHCRSNPKYGDDDEAMLATVTVGLSLATAALGVGLIVIGKLKLASYVQLLPTSVVAGYLAYIGWFVGWSGLGIMAGNSSLTPAVMMEKIVFIAPGVAGGTLIYVSVRKFRHVAVLPLCIFFLIVMFYIIMSVTGTSIETATEKGWIRESEDQPAWYQTWDYFKFDKIVWSAFPQLWLTWLGMLFVVALSSSLDVAAIELEMKKPLNYDKELGVVGISNFVSGMTGGYTGSYIFSQTIFSLRIGVRSRIAGFSIAAFQLIVILCPFPILSYVPNFFYGSLLSMICIDLVYEWLWEFRTKVTKAEYVIGLSTFCFIQLLGVEYGIILGVTLYFVCRRFRIDVGELKEIISVDDDDENDVSKNESRVAVMNGNNTVTDTSAENKETTKLVRDFNQMESYDSR